MTASEFMKSISHNQQLKGIPSIVHSLESIGIVDFPAELSDDSFNNIGGRRHARILKECEIKGSQLFNPFNKMTMATSNKEMSFLTPVPESLRPMLESSNRNYFPNPLGKVLDAAGGPPVFIFEISLPRPISMDQTELYGDLRENLTNGGKKPQVTVDNDPLDRIMYFISQLQENSFPIRFILGFNQRGIHDVLSRSICGEKESMLDPFDSDISPVRQKHPTPLGLEFCGDRNERFTVGSHVVYPFQGCVGFDIKFSPHSTKRCLLVEVQLGCLILLFEIEFPTSCKCFQASQTLKSLNPFLLIAFPPSISPGPFNIFGFTSRTMSFFRS